MIVELLLFTVLSNSVVQALPISNLKPTSTDASCKQTISWYREITEQTKRLYNEYYGDLAEASINSENLQKLNEKHMNFENIVSKVYKGPNDDLEKEIDCQIEIDWYKNMNANFTKVAADIKKELLYVLNRSEVPLSQQKDIIDLLNGLANFLSTVNFSTNQIKDLKTLIIESQSDQEDKLLESARKGKQGHHEINSNFANQEMATIFASSYVNRPTYHPVHHTSHTEMHTERHEDRHYYTTKHPPSHHTIYPVQQKYIPETAIALGCIVLIVIVIAIVAVSCPCQRSPYRQF